jgi:hypothetical protein
VLKHLTRPRRARLAAALEASEHPDEFVSESSVVEAIVALQSAVRALRALDAVAYLRSPLKAAIDLRIARLSARRAKLRALDRQRVVAQVLALAALGRAAGHPVLPCRRDIKRRCALLARGGSSS